METPEKIIVGFTGTQRGLTSAQLEQLRYVLTKLQPQIAEFHHGDCVGADAQAHQIAKELGLFVAIHPPSDSRKQAHCVGGRTYPPKPYLDRNHDIVDISYLLIGGSGTPDETIRSGTWATIRYGKKSQKKVLVIFPDGSVKSHGKRERDGACLSLC